MGGREAVCWYGAYVDITGKTGRADGENLENYAVG
jgi:hypothetical protein